MSLQRDRKAYAVSAQTNIVAEAQPQPRYYNYNANTGPYASPYKASSSQYSGKYKQSPSKPKANWEPSFQMVEKEEEKQPEPVRQPAPSSSSYNGYSAYSSYDDKPLKPAQQPAKPAVTTAASAYVQPSKSVVQPAPYSNAMYNKYSNPYAANPYGQPTVPQPQPAKPAQPAPVTQPAPQPAKPAPQPTQPAKPAQPATQPAAPKPAAAVSSSTSVSAPPPVTADPYAAYASMAEAAPKKCAIAKALFIGVNYLGQRGVELKGCINDVNNSLNRLKDLGFDAKDEVNLRILTEKTRRKPNKQEILDSMKWLTDGNKDGDCLWFHFSGHGSQQKAGAADKDERDGLNETIVPLDFQRNGQVVDNELYKTLVQPLKKGCTLYAIFDCCHSGTVLDLRYVYDETSNTLDFDETIRERRDDEGTAILLSGCLSVQTSADLPPGFAGMKADSVGAMTSSYLPLLDKNLSWGHFIQGLRTNLKKSKLEQVPQLEMSRQINLTSMAFAAAFPAAAAAVASTKGAGGGTVFKPVVSDLKAASGRLYKLKKKNEAKAAAAEAATAIETSTDNDGGYNPGDEESAPADTSATTAPPATDATASTTATAGTRGLDAATFSPYQPMYKQDLNRSSAAFGGSTFTVPESKAKVNADLGIQLRGRVKGGAPSQQPMTRGLPAVGATVVGIPAVPKDVQLARRAGKK